jgi:hypothetical protein
MAECWWADKIKVIEECSAAPGAPGEYYCFGNTEEGCTSECYIDMIGNEAANCAVFGGVWNSLSNQCVKYEPIPGEYVSYQLVRCALMH